MTTNGSPERSFFSVLSKYWAIVAGGIVLVAGLWKAQDIHSRDIESLQKADVEIRQDIKELRTEQNQLSRNVADSLSEIKVQLKELSTTLKFISEGEKGLGNGTKRNQ